MTVLPTPRRVVDGQPCKPGARIRAPRYGKCVSVTAATHARVAAAAEQHGCTMADIVRAACASILEPEPPR